MYNYIYIPLFIILISNLSLITDNPNNISCRVLSTLLYIKCLNTLTKTHTLKLAYLHTCIPLHTNTHTHTQKCPQNTCYPISVCMHTHTYVLIHACSSMQARTHAAQTPIIHAFINTSTRRHARMLFLRLGRLGFDEFYKKKFVTVC